MGLKALNRRRRHEIYFENPENTFHKRTEIGLS